MDKIIAFLTKYKNWFLAGIVILLILGVFVGGFVAGKSKQKAEDLKAQESALKADIKAQQNIVTTSTAAATNLIDSAGIYEAFARKQSAITQKTTAQIKKQKNDTQQNISNIDHLSNDSNVHLFSRLAQDYINSPTQ